MYIGHVREISGRVISEPLADSAAAGNKVRAATGPNEGVRGISIRLYCICREEDGKDALTGEKIRVYGEKLLRAVRTGKSGYYRFLVPDGKYIVCVDRQTVPAGFAVEEDERIVEFRAGTEKINPRLLIKTEVNFKLRKADASASGIQKSGAAKSGGAKSGGAKSGGAKSGGANSGAANSGAAKVDAIAPEAGAARPSAIKCRYREMSPAEKLEEACRRGQISERDKILNLIYSVFDRDRLSEEYRSLAPVKSGTGALEEGRRSVERPDADESVVETYRKLLALSIPVLDRNYKSPGGFFNIHYTLKGDNAVENARRLHPGAPGTGVPRYIRLMAESFDSVRENCRSRGFRLPVTEAGKNTMDIYVCDLKKIYGYTSSITIRENGPSKARTASCYICLDNSYSSSKGFVKSREDCMRVTAAHEFFHAVQYSYNVDADSWWKEATATWNEDEIYKGINDYVRYIPNYFSSPQKSLDEISYAGVVFVKYLSENHGGCELVRGIWEEHAKGINSSKSAIDRAIRSKDPKEDISSAFDRFTAYNFNPPQYYRDGAEWDAKVSISEDHNKYPVSLETDKLNHLASCYILFRPDETGAKGPARFILEGSGKARWGFKLQKRAAGSSLCSLTEVDNERFLERMEVAVEGFGRSYSELCLIPANLETERDELSFSYSASV